MKTFWSGGILVQFENLLITKIASAILSLILPLTCIPGVLMAQDPGNSSTASREEWVLQAKAITDRSYRYLDGVSSIIEPNIQDFEWLVDHVDSDPESVVAWIQNHIRFTPYKGHLREANAILMSGKANLVDMNLLLARVLEAKGHPVRMAWRPGNLPPTLITAMSDRLQSQMEFEPVAAENDYYVRFLNPERLDDFSATLEIEQDTAHALLLNEWMHYKERVESAQATTNLQAQQLLSQIQRNQSGTDWIPADQPYGWVQYQVGSEWQSICSLMGKSRVTDLFPHGEIEFTARNAVPEPFVHTVTLKVHVQQKTGKKIHSAVALEHQFSVPRYGNHSFKLSFEPLGAESIQSVMDEWLDSPKTALEKYFESLQSVDDWAPILAIKGENNLGQMKFDREGNVSEITAVKTASDQKLNEADGLIGGLGFGASKPTPDVPEVSTLHKVELEWGYTDSNLTPVSVRRVLYEDTPSDHDLVGAMTRRFDGIIQNSEYQNHWMMKKSIADANQNRLAAKYLIAKSADLNRQAILELIDKVSERIEEPNPWLCEMTSMRILDSRSYINSPNILTFHHQFRTEISGDTFPMTSGFDIVSNEVNHPSESSAERFESNIREGVWDSVLESKVLEWSAEVVKVLSASNQLAQSEPDAWQLTHVSDRHHALQLEHDSGAVYWQIDPKTGNTLGMLRSSLGITGGSDTTEYLTLMQIVSLFGRQLVNVAKYVWCLHRAQQGDSITTMRGGQKSPVSGAVCTICLALAMIWTTVTYSENMLVHGAGQAVLGATCYNFSIRDIYERAFR